MESGYEAGHVMATLLVIISPWILHTRFAERHFALKWREAEDTSIWSYPDDDPEAIKSHYCMPALMASKEGVIYRASGWTMAATGLLGARWAHGSDWLADVSAWLFLAAILTGIGVFVAYCQRGP